MSATHGTNLFTDDCVVCLDPSNKGYRKTPFHIQDHSGNGNDGYLAGGSMTTTYWTNVTNFAAESDAGLVFDLDSPQVWTISLLLKLPVISRAGTLSRIAGTNGVIDRGEIAIYTGTNEVWVNPPKGSWMPLEVGSAGITLNLDETAYICVTFKRNTDVSNIIGFKNGVKVVETTSSGADEGGISGYTLGSRSDFNGEYLPIEVYHATVHERALTEQEVAQNFEALRRRVTISSGIPHGT